MRLIAAAVLLCLSAGARAEELCSSGDAKGSRLAMTLSVWKKDEAPPAVTYMHVAATSVDGAYRMSVWYHPTEAWLGKPVMAAIEIRMPVPDPERAEAERIEWRAGSGDWFDPGYWGNPRRIGSDPKDVMGSVRHIIAQSGVHAYRTELLDTFGPGVRWEFRRLDRNGRAIGSGAVDYPALPAVEALYRRARARGVAGLRPCGGSAPPITASPAPPPPMTIVQGSLRSSAPPAPRNPADLDSDACGYFRRQEKLAAEREPEAGARVWITGQVVDCAARSVTRILAVKSIPRRERRELAAAVQSLSDRLWCSTLLFREVMKRGWTLGAELRAPGDPKPIAATTRKCA